MHAVSWDPLGHHKIKHQNFSLNILLCRNSESIIFYYKSCIFVELSSSMYIRYDLEVLGVPGGVIVEFANDLW